ncbi:MAG: tetratricopeptide repeat protein, partial [Leisingera sp.]
VVALAATNTNPPSDHFSAPRGTMRWAGASRARRDFLKRKPIDAGRREARLDAVEAIRDDRRNKRGGAEDNYAQARRTLIAEGRDQSGAKSVPAE